MISQKHNETSVVYTESWWACAICSTVFNTTYPEGQWCANNHEPKLVSKRVSSEHVVDRDGHNWKGKYVLGHIYPTR